MECTERLTRRFLISKNTGFILFGVDTVAFIVTLFEDIFKPMAILYTTGITSDYRKTTHNFFKLSLTDMRNISGTAGRTVPADLRVTMMANGPQLHALRMHGRSGCRQRGEP